jgi:hypothetical protein
MSHAARIRPAEHAGIVALKESLDDVSTDFHALAGAVKKIVHKGNVATHYGYHDKSPVALYATLHAAATGLSAFDWALAGTQISDAEAATSANVLNKGLDRLMQPVTNVFNHLSDDAKLHLLEALANDPSVATKFGIENENIFQRKLDGLKEDFKVTEKGMDTELSSAEKSAAEREFMKHRVSDIPELSGAITTLKTYFEGKQKELHTSCQQIISQGQSAGGLGGGGS